MKSTNNSNQENLEEENSKKKPSKLVSPDYKTTFLNEKHKELFLKSMKSIQEMKKTPMNYEEELKRHREMQIKAAKMEEEYLKQKNKL